ncbi:MAG: MBL fold metallo-hydrolase [Chitinophagaceae bacterium]|nr:MBL fold metallo-hydrolase [Chitinophagaceae bacterium]
MFTIRQFTFNPIQENTYVIFNEKDECLIIDPGCYFENERKELTDFIDINKLVPKCLLNTHCHLDHIFGNKLIAERYGLPVRFHRMEKRVFDNAPAAGLSWNMPLENYTGELIFLEEGSDVALGDLLFRVLFTPGHSPGSISFYCEKEKILFSGDVLFRQGIGRTDLPGGNYDTLISSINTQLLTLPENTTVYPGHGPKTTIGYEKINNPFLV